MENLKHFPLLSFVVISVALFSCSKPNENATDTVDPISTPTTPTVKKNCRVVKAVYYDNNATAFDSSEFSYTDTLLTKVTEAYPQPYYYTFEYSNGRLVRRNHFKVGSTNTAYTTFNYDSTGKVVEIAIYNNSIKSVSYDFKYNTDKLVSVMVKSYYQGLESVMTTYTYTYTGNNISKSVIENVSSGTATLDYTYDGTGNYFNLKRPDAFKVEPYFFTKEGTLYPYFFSANNLIKVIYNGQTTGVHNYVTNSEGYLTEMYQNGKISIRYQYECR